VSLSLNSKLSRIKSVANFQMMMRSVFWLRFFGVGCVDNIINLRLGFQKQKDLLNSLIQRYRDASAGAHPDE
jgi:hypothetical protein